MATNYTVRPGDTLGKIAARYGFSNYREIYDHPANAAFKAKRPNPNLIFPGDVIVIPDRGVSPSGPPAPPAPPSPPTTTDPRELALSLRPEPTLWLERSIAALQALATLLHQGLPEFLHVHDSTRTALRTHFHMDNPEQSHRELDFIIARFRDIHRVITLEAEAQYHTATPEQEQDLISRNKFLPMAATMNRSAGNQGSIYPLGTTFTSTYVNPASNCVDPPNCRKMVLIHEALHFVDPQPRSPDVVDIPEWRPDYDNTNVMPLQKAIHNPSSYAACAWQLAYGRDGARNFCFR
jgi:hypothetical protein